jgi:glucose/arabinose dehydrogenase
VSLEPASGCQLVRDGFGPKGEVPIEVSVVARGLDVPWSIAFLPNGDALVTERPGRVRMVHGMSSGAASVEPEPVLTLPVSKQDEGGLLGLAIHPRFVETRTFFVYYTADIPKRSVNRVARYVLDAEGRTAREGRIVFDGIDAAKYHDGGRLKFGPDGMLYVSTGDAREPKLAQDPESPSGKLLRLTPEGIAPGDNPSPGKPGFLLGIRNLQAFDWLDDDRIVLADHGPSGERPYLRFGHDEVSVARRGDNLGWPDAWRCEAKLGTVSPLLVWKEAMPPGGGVFYRGDAIPAWKNSFLIATLKSEHLHRVALTSDGQRVANHEVYLEGERPRGYGRLREVVTGPDGAVYVTTSNCDGSGKCPATRDEILRIRQRNQDGSAR